VIPEKADALVVYGITGDLARRMVIPALYQLVAAGQLDMPIVGVALADHGDDGLRRHARDAVQTAVGQVDEHTFAKLAGQLSMVAGDYREPSTFQQLRGRVLGSTFLAHHCVVPPSLFATVAAGAATAAARVQAGTP
jgi:glucose-6-phosphate 1-dehydrogenase